MRWRLHLVVPRFMELIEPGKVCKRVGKPHYGESFHYIHCRSTEYRGENPPGPIDDRRRQCSKSRLHIYNEFLRLFSSVG